MFDDTLLDSSLLRAPGLSGRDQIISALVGVGSFLIALWWLPAALGPRQTLALVAQSALIGAGLAFYVLVLCYIHADAQQLGRSAWAWVGVAFLLNAAGFLIYLTYSAFRTGHWKRATMPLAYILEFTLLGALVLVPLIYTEALPKSLMKETPLAPPPPPALPPRPARRAGVVPRPKQPDVIQAPVAIPKKIFRDEPEPPLEPPGGDVPGSVPGGVPGGMPAGVPRGFLADLSMAPLPPPPKGPAVRRIHVGGQVEAAKLIFQPKPEYPPLAKMARIQGTVRLEAVIGKDGTIQDLRALSGPPLLLKPALEAVSRWRYRPTLLNGEPVEVVTEIVINFTLAE